MIEFLVSNMTEVVGLLVAFIMIIYAIITRQWGIVKSSALSFMLSAERLMKTKKGHQKMEEVFTVVWAYMPKIFTKFITEEKMKALLQKWYEESREALVKKEM